MSYDFYDPYRANQNPNYTNPYNLPTSMPNPNMNPMPYAGPNPNLSPYANPNPKPAPGPKSLKNTVLSAVDPAVKHGLKEGKHTSPSHALRETAAIAYLMGMGYTFAMAKQTVESWEIDEMFYPHSPY
jgi:hypothetical protein